MSKIVVTGPEITEEAVMDWFKRVADARLKLREVQFESDMFCFSYVHEDSIHMSHYWFKKVSEVLQATTTFDPNWDKKHEVVYAYFYVFIDGRKWKIFSLLNW